MEEIVVSCNAYEPTTTKKSEGTGIRQPIFEQLVSRPHNYLTHKLDILTQQSPVHTPQKCRVFMGLAKG